MNSDYSEGAPPNGDRAKIGQRFVNHGLITENAVDAVIHQQQQIKQRFCSTAVQMGLISEKQALEHLGFQLGYPTVTTWELLKTNELGGLISLPFARMHRVVPFRRFQRSIMVAMRDPDDQSLLTVLETDLGSIVRPILALDAAIDVALAQWEQAQTTLSTSAPQSLPQRQSDIQGDVEETRPNRTQSRSPEEIIDLRRSRERFRHGLMRLKEGDVAAAITSLQESVHLDPFQDRAQYYLGRAHAEQNNIDLACLAFERAVALNPHEYSSQYALARCYELLGRKKDAILAWQDTALIAPDAQRREHIVLRLAQLESDANPS